MKTFSPLRCRRLRLAVALALAVAATALQAAAPIAAPAKFRKIVFGCYARDLKEFEAFARRAKESGATHIVLTAEDLPWARWQYDTPGDPYPSWAISNHGLLKVSVPDALQGYIPPEYSGQIMQVLRDRCRVLGKLGLKGMVTSFEPQMLPEKVYEDHPLWRGPQVDSPRRSRVPRFTPDIDNPEVLALYRESLRKLTAACPEIDTLSFYTNDSGSGMSWSEGSYQGANGNSFNERRPMYQRYHDFFAALRAGAADSGVANLEVDVRWDREKDPALLATKLEEGMAIANFEGPNATPYKGEVGYLLDYLYPFYPVCGIPVGIKFLEEVEKAHRVAAPRLFVLMGDRFNQELYFSLYDAFRARPTHNFRERQDLLRTVAARQVGEENADLLVEAWQALYRAEEDISLLHQGGTIFYLGSVQQRWLTRPFVPFPAELKPEEKDYYRRYQFQATTEDRAENLQEIQGTRSYSGIGGRSLSHAILGRIIGNAEEARRKVAALASLQAGKAADFAPLLEARLLVLQRVARNCRNATNYQYYLEVAREWPLVRPNDIPLLKNIPEWTALRRTAREEIDNVALLIQLLESGKPDLIQMAPTPAETDIRLLEPTLTQSLRTKLKIMLAHWEDYERLFAGPQPSP